MKGLIILGGGLVGGVVGGYVGIGAMMFFADLDGPGVLTWVPAGVAIGACVGVYTTAQLVT